MKKLYFSIVTLAMVLFMGMSTAAKAQHTVTVNSAPHNNYESGGDKFSPKEIAEALGTDTATLHKLISDDGNANVYLKSGEGKTNEYTGNPNEFWMNTDGAPVGYGKDGCCWFSGIRYVPAGVDAETEEPYEAYVYVYVGQYPDYFKKIYTPSALSCTMYIVNGEKEVSFDITQNVEAGKEPTLVAPKTLLSEITVLKDYTLVLPFIVGKEYEGKTYSTTLDGVYEALGADASELDESISDYVLTQTIVSTKGTDADSTITYAFCDSLKTPAVASGGSWFGRYINYEESIGEDVPLPMNGPRAWSSGCTFYTQDIKLSNGEFSIVSGQYPSTMAVGDTDWTYLYIVVGDKAVRIKVQADVQNPPVIDPSQMVKVGEATIEVEAVVDNSYLTKNITVDMAAVTEALGCAASDLSDVYAYSQDNSISDDHTEGSGGFYFNENGQIEKWGDNAACFIARTTTSLTDGVYSIGQMANHFKDITEPTTVKPQIIFQNAEKYFVVTIEYTVKPESTGGDDKPEMVFVAREPIFMEMIPSDDTWEYATKTALDLDYIEGKIGTKDFTLYTDKANTKDNVTTIEMSKAYSCTPYPGFWYGDKTYTNDEGQVIVENAGYGSNSFGITYANGQITWWQYPGQRKVGDKYLASLYLVNEETGKYLQYLLNVSYVETETPKSEVVATANDTVIVYPEKMEDAGIYYVNFDNKMIADSLGLAEETLADNVTMYAFKTPNTITSFNVDDEITLAYDGYMLAEGDDSPAINVSVSKNEDNALYFGVDVGNLTFEKENADKAVVRIAFEANSKRIDYVFTLLSEDSPIITAVDRVGADGKTVNAIYNASGVKSGKLSKGINIVKYSDGSCKKVLVK